MRHSRSSSALSRPLVKILTPMKHHSSFCLIVLFLALLFLVTLKIHFKNLRMESPGRESLSSQWWSRLEGLSWGIVEPRLDLEIKPLWEDAGVKVSDDASRAGMQTLRSMKCPTYCKKRAMVDMHAICLMKYPK